MFQLPNPILGVTRDCLSAQKLTVGDFAQRCIEGSISMTDDIPFSGAKIVLHSDRQLVAYLRDEKPEIPFPGLWDLPEGGREFDETPAQCAMREVEEEFGLSICIERVVWSRRYERNAKGGLCTCFLAAPLRPEEIGQIAFGSEGQRWRMMSFEEFLGEKMAVPDLQLRLQEFVTTLN